MIRTLKRINDWLTEPLNVRLSPLTILIIMLPFIFVAKIWGQVIGVMSCVTP